LHNFFCFNPLRVSVLFVIAAMMIYPAGRSFALNSSSGVNGVVTDSSGAVVPGAKVALVNVATNVERDTRVEWLRRLLLQRRSTGQLHTHLHGLGS
jgi:hypothetical protein